MTDQGFEKIRYQGEEVLRDLDVDDSTSVVYYEHIYRSSFKDIKSRDPSTGRHMCMQWGHWCWKQAREYPFDAVKFLLGRFKRGKN